MDDELDTTCPLHGCALLDGAVPVFFGFFGCGQKYGPAGRNSFRYARSWSAGGCSVSGGRPAVAEVRYCPVCRVAEREWLQEQLAAGVDEASWEWFLAGVLGLREGTLQKPNNGVAPDCGEGGKAHRPGGLIDGE